MRYYSTRETPGFPPDTAPGKDTCKHAIIKKKRTKEKNASKIVGSHDGPELEGVQEAEVGGLGEPRPEDAGVDDRKVERWN